MASLTSVLAPLRAAIVGLRIAAGEGSALEFQQVRNATKKAGGSSNNGRKTAGKRLGIKIHDGAAANAGSIIVRQRGTTIHPGLNVGCGRDYTLFALTEGIVKITRQPTNFGGKTRKLAHVLPVGSPELTALMENQVQKKAEKAEKADASLAALRLARGC